VYIYYTGHESHKTIIEWASRATEQPEKAEKAENRIMDGRKYGAVIG
jgi:hypothetical protein